MRPERSTALVARELQKYNVDIAALSEVRLPDSGSLKEQAGGYTFYWQGKPETEKRESGVGFAIKNSIKLSELPVGHSDRIISLRIPINNDRSVHLISVYAPTMQHTDTTKDAFYAELSGVIKSVRECDKIFVLGDFNARVGNDHVTWPSVLGHHGIGNANSNGYLLLSMCAENNLTITNTQFQLPNKLKTTWKHARSGHWHLIDYVLTKQKDLSDVHITRVMRGADCWTDHRLLISIVDLKFKKPSRNNAPTISKKFNVSKLKNGKTVTALRNSIETQLKNVETPDWNILKSSLLHSAETVLGHAKANHKDWFDDNDEEIQELLAKRSNARGDQLKRIKQDIKNRIRSMKDRWWKARAEETQHHADAGNTKELYKSLNGIYGPRKSSTVPLLSADGNTLLQTPEDIKERWTEHFTQLLSVSSTVDDSIIHNLEQKETVESLADVPTLDEVEKAIRQMKCGKSAGPDGIPPEIFVYGGPEVAKNLHEIIVIIWNSENIPAELINANIITIFKKNDRHNVSNYRGISLLAVAGKILARIMLNRMRDPISECVLPESQCGFRGNRGTADMVFALRQIMEKSREQNCPLFMSFVDFTKAFDTVHRDALWIVMSKMGCPEKFVNILKCLHNNMTVRISVNGELTREIPYNNGVKQGCILAPTLFAIFAAAMFTYAFRDLDDGIYIRFRTDGSLFNLARLRSHSKCTVTVMRELQYADDCALLADSEEKLQTIMNKFSEATAAFGLTINTNKTEIMSLNHCPITGHITVNDKELANVDTFKYLGSTITSDCKLDKELDSRIQCASTSFGRLWGRLWSSHDITKETKMNVYTAVVTSAMLYGAESWTLYQGHIKRLRRLQQRHLRAILRISYKDRVTNDEVLDSANVPDVEVTLRKVQLRWAGHVSRMTDARIPKQLLFGEIGKGKRNVGRPYLRWKDSLKDTLKQCKISTTLWQDTASNRNNWRQTTHDGLKDFDDSRRTHNAMKRARRHASRNADPSTTTCNYACQYCNRPCTSRIGILSHERACAKQQPVT